MLFAYFILKTVRIAFKIFIYISIINKITKNININDGPSTDWWMAQAPY